MKRIVLTMAVFISTIGSALAEDSVSVNPIAQLREHGTLALVSGSIQCRAGYNSDLYARLTQANKNGGMVEYTGNDTFICSGGSQSWEARVFTDAAPFKAGSADVFVEVYYCDQAIGDCHYITATGRVRLKNGK